MIYCKGYNISLNERRIWEDIYRSKDKGVNNQESAEKIQNKNTPTLLRKKKVRVGLVHMKTYGWHGGIGPCINLGTRWRWVCASCFVCLTYITHWVWGQMVPKSWSRHFVKQKNHLPQPYIMQPSCWAILALNKVKSSSQYLWHSLSGYTFHKYRQNNGSGVKPPQKFQLTFLLYLLSLCSVMDMHSN